jgi:signal transduction histidine kinase
VEGLRPPAVDELGLVGALTQQATRMHGADGHPLAVRVDVPVPLPALPAAVEVAAYRIVAEAVTNVVRHAAATTCCITLDVVGRVLRIGVTDDGGGLDPAAVGSGSGLQTMRERAEELRGRLRVTGGPGTSVVAELPLPAASSPARQRAAAPA